MLTKLDHDSCENMIFLKKLVSGKRDGLHSANLWMSAHKVVYFLRTMHIFLYYRAKF